MVMAEKTLLLANCLFEALTSVSATIISRKSRKQSWLMDGCEPATVSRTTAPGPHAVKGFVPAALGVSRKCSLVTAGDIKSFCLAHGPAYAHPRYVELI